MTPHAEFTHFAGFDWASDHHDIIIVDAAGALIADFRSSHWEYPANRSQFRFTR
jgi:hypothetical protein